MTSWIKHPPAGVVPTSTDWPIGFRVHKDGRGKGLVWCGILGRRCLL
ncbi:hypothetical protein AVEN_52875-1, partial [Araneus ventricosus]